MTGLGRHANASDSMVAKTGRWAMAVAWLGSIEALLRRAVLIWHTKAEGLAGEAPDPVVESAAAPEALSPGSAELNRYFRDEYGHVHVLL